MAMPSTPSPSETISQWFAQVARESQQATTVVDTTTVADIKNGKMTFSVKMPPPPLPWIDISFEHWGLPSKPTVHAGHSSKNDTRTCCTCNARTAKGSEGFVLKARGARRLFACSLDCALGVVVAWELKHGA